MSYQHYDAPDADHDPARGHLRPAEQKRRHVGVRSCRSVGAWFYFWFTKTEKRFKPEDDSQTEAPCQLILITRLYSEGFDNRRDRQRSDQWEHLTLHAPPLPLRLTNGVRLPFSRNFLFIPSSFCCPIFTVFLWTCDLFIIKNRTAALNVCASDNTSFLKISQSSQWKPANDSELANVTEANFS